MLTLSKRELELVILIIDKVDFRIKKIVKDTEGHYITTKKVSNPQDSIEHNDS